MSSTRRGSRRSLRARRMPCWSPSRRRGERLHYVPPRRAHRHHRPGRRRGGGARPWSRRRRCPRRVEWFPTAVCAQVRVVTQGRNVAARRLYQRHGFLTSVARPLVPPAGIDGDALPHPVQPADASSGASSTTSRRRSRAGTSPATARSRAAARRCSRRSSAYRAGAADDVVHARARDGRAAARHRARRRGRSSRRSRSFRRQRVRAARRRPVFVDIRPDTLNLDERALETLVTERTRAIVPCTTPASRCEMDAIGAARQRVGLASSRTTRTASSALPRAPLGTFGALATRASTRRRTSPAARAARCSSTTRASSSAPRSSARRARTGAVLPRAGRQVHLGRPRARATCRPTCSRRSSSRSSRRASAIQARAAAIWERYAARSPTGRRPPAPAAGRAGPLRAGVPHVLPAAAPLEERDALIAHLRARGILAVFHYLPLHLSADGPALRRTRGPVPGYRGRQRAARRACPSTPACPPPTRPR